MGHFQANKAPGDRILVREAVFSDLPAIASLEKACFSDPWSYDELASCMQKEFYLFLTAVLRGETAENDTVAGYISLYRVLDEGNIADLAVSPSARRQGIGRRLMETLIEKSRELGIRTLYLEARTKNIPATALYESAGFRQVGLRKDYYSDPKDDARIYRLDI